MLSIEELKETYPEPVVALFESALAQGKSDANPRFALTRVLVQLGKYNLHTVLPLLQQALTSKTFNLRWAALHELVELGKFYPQQTLQLLEHTLSAQEPASQLSETRIVVELGQENFANLVPLVEQALQSQNTDLQWVCTLEIIELAAVQPKLMIPLLERILQSENLHLKWLATLELVELAKSYPQLVMPILMQTLDKESQTPSKCTSSPKVIRSNSSLQQALANGDEDQQWAAVMELTDLAVADPEQAIPLFRQALLSKNTNIQWAIMVELIKLAKIHPQQTIPLLQEIVNADDLNYEFKNLRFLVELGKEDLPQALSVFDYALQKGNSNVYSAATLELFELLEVHIQNLLPLLTSKLSPNQLNTLKKTSEGEHLQKIVYLLEKSLEKIDLDLQWTTLHKLIKLKLFTPEKVLSIIEKMVKRYSEQHTAQLASTRVLVELGQQYPQLSAPIMQYALTIDDEELQWATILELLALIKLCPQMIHYFQNNQLEVDAVV